MYLRHSRYTALDSGSQFSNFVIYSYYLLCGIYCSSSAVGGGGGSEMTRQGLNSPASSIDSSSRPSLSSSSSISNKPIATRSSSRTDLTADLRLGLGISASQQSHHQVQDIYFTNARLTMATEGGVQYNDCDWPPIKALLRSNLASDHHHHHHQTLFVKVYMEGIPIGRKLDLLAHEGYQHLIQTLTFMFRTTIILHPDLALHEVPSSETHVLTYEDKEGDWMLVGDVPWEMFLTNVKRLKISRANKC